MALPSSKIPSALSYRQQPSGTWISTKAFNGELRTYSTYQNAQFQTVGLLGTNAAATAANCPAGRILHANGKILLPGVNPNVTKPYIGVYDSATGLNGYIDASSPTFAKYDVNLPAQYDLGGADATNSGGATVPYLGGQGAKVQVGPVTPLAVRATATTNTTPGTIRRLDVTAVAQGVITLGALVTGAGIPAGTTIVAFVSGTGGTGTYTLRADMTAAASVSIIMSGVPFASGTQNAGDACVGQFVMDNNGDNAVVATTACKASSIVLLTQVAGTATSAPTVVAADGSFTVTCAPGTADAVFNFLIIN